LWAAYYEVQLAVQHPDKVPPPNMLAALADFERALVAQAIAPWREALEGSVSAIADALEWLDGHAAPDVTQPLIERKLYAVQDVNSALLHPNAEGGSNG